MLIHILNQEQERKDAEADGARRAMRAKNIGAAAASKQGAKKPRKNTANKASTTTLEDTSNGISIILSL